MAKIRHIAIISDDPERLGNFYVDVYGMEITGHSQGDVWITDGYMDIALIHQNNVPNQKTGINHYGITISPNEKTEIYSKMEALGLDPFDPRTENPNLDRPFVEHAAFDIDGNRFDISTGKRDLVDEKNR